MNQDWEKEFNEGGLFWVAAGDLYGSESNLEILEKQKQFISKVAQEEYERGKSDGFKEAGLYTSEQRFNRNTKI